jgi:hypothetical protein
MLAVILWGLPGVQAKYSPTLLGNISTDAVSLLVLVGLVELKAA